MSVNKRKKVTHNEAVIALEQEMQSMQKWRDEYARRMASDSMMYFLVHQREFTTAQGKMTRDTLQWINNNRKVIDDLLQSITAHLVKTCAPNANPDNRAEVEEEIGPELCQLLDAINNNDEREVDPYMRKAFIYFALGMCSDIRAFVYENSKKAGEVEERRVADALRFVVEHTKVFLHAGAVTWAPVHSEIISYVEAIDLYYNNMSLKLTTYFESYRTMLVIALCEPPLPFGSQNDTMY